MTTNDVGFYMKCRKTARAGVGDNRKPILKKVSGSIFSTPHNSNSLNLIDKVGQVSYKKIGIREVTKEKNLPPWERIWAPEGKHTGPPR
jgi:hypothetical protein